MSELDAFEKKKPSRFVKSSKWIGERLAAAAIFWGIITFSLTWGWWLVQPRIEERFEQTFPGFRELPNRVEKMSGDLRDNTREMRVVRRSVDNNRRRIEDLSAEQRIARYDQNPNSSRVFGPCFRGKLCRVRFVLARTEYGINCNVVSGQPFVANHSGEPHETFYEATPDDHEWTPSLEFKPFVRSFRVPMTVENGESSFYSKLIYTGCSKNDPDRREAESTISLRFSVIDG